MISELMIDGALFHYQIRELNEIDKFLVAKTETIT